jgi:hypothetical protein
MTQDVRDMRQLLEELAEHDLAIMTDGSMTWKPRADPNTTITFAMDGSWRFERDGVALRKGKAEDGTAALGAALGAYQRWLKIWTARREAREVQAAQEALYHEHCVPTQFVKT